MVCRVQYQRDYSGEEVGERCGHCDSCASGLAERSARVAARPDRAQPAGASG